jgi:hypothetical protein
MPEIDDERLEYLMELVTKEHPDLDRYVVWVLCINQLLNEQVIYGDENVAEEIRQKRHQEAQFKIQVI